jgi:4-hydroxybenzoate polyprenyltransferase
MPEYYNENTSNTDYISFDTTIPLVVDLDGTLIFTDLLYEAIILFVKKNPLNIFLCFLWLFKGKVYFKNKIFSIVIIQSKLLPYNRALIDFLEKEKAKGRKIILATASPLPIAIEIAGSCPIFSEVYGTENKVNLKGANKLKLLTEKFGKGKFDYIANSLSDVKIFTSCRYSYLVNPSKSLEKRTIARSNLKYVWHCGKNSPRDYLKAMRVYQWLKNLLLFVPLITSHLIGSVPLFVKTLEAFFLFSFVASAGYLINDLLDLNADRAHPRKKFRALASGKLSIPSVFILAFILFSVGIFFAIKINFLFFIVLLSYFFLSMIYSLYLKKIILYDIFILTVLYSIRIVAGGIVVNVVLSFWLIAFSVFLFLSLAFVKRCSELIQIGKNNDLKNRGRGYSGEDIILLQIMGIVCGFMSIIVFSLYINSAEVVRLYAQPKILWLISFLFLFWISRIWFYTIRGKMTDDPIIFAVKDITSYFIFLFTALIILLSKYSFL